MQQLSDRYGGAALVTGASSGFGEAFARALAARGMDVVLVARRKEKLDALATELQAQHSITATVLAQDLTAPDADTALLAQVDAAGIEVGLLVNNAGFGNYGAFLDQDPGSEAGMVDLNCRAVLAMTHRFARPMVDRGRGGVIIVASMAGFQPTPYLSTYGATKAFDLMLAEALWAELKPLGVDVLGLCPGYVETGFQAVADAGEMPVHGSVLSSEEVVTAALDALGVQPSIVPGVLNKLLTFGGRLAPRSFVAQSAMRLNRPKDAPKTNPPSRPDSDTGHFQRDMMRMLVTFFSVVLVDLIVVSLLTGKLRFWFPVWINPNWETDPNAWIIYSQSYFAGIFFIPLLINAVNRDFIRPRGGPWSAVLWGAAAAVFAFILWWKGGLMLQHHKQWEALGWLALSGLLWSLVLVAEGLPARMAAISRRRLLRGLMFGIAVFFLVMAVLDPLFQIVIQKMSWSSGLIIEVGFFIPAGLGLMWLHRRLESSG